MNPTHEETNAGSYTEPFVHTQYGVFTITKEGKTKFVSSCVSADSALSRAALYYHDMWKHDHNKKTMDMSEIERFFVRTRDVTYSPWDEGSTAARDAARPDNPWRQGKHRHWSSDE